MSERKCTEIQEKISSGSRDRRHHVWWIAFRATTLLMGGPGSGKTVLALQMLVGASRLHQTPGIFVAFEENARRVSANGKTFGWNMCALEKEQIYSSTPALGPTW